MLELIVFGGSAPLAGVLFLSIDSRHRDAERVYADVRKGLEPAAARWFDGHQKGFYRLAAIASGRTDPRAYAHDVKDMGRLAGLFYRFDGVKNSWRAEDVALRQVSMESAMKTATAGVRSLGEQVGDMERLSREIGGDLRRNHGVLGPRARR